MAMARGREVKNTGAEDKVDEDADAPVGRLTAYELAREQQYVRMSR